VQATENVHTNRVQESILKIYSFVFRRQSVVITPSTFGRGYCFHRRLYVCLLAGQLKKLCVDFHEI